VMGENLRWSETARRLGCRAEEKKRRENEGGRNRCRRFWANLVVDEIEDAKSPKFQTAQHLSTSCRILLKRSMLKIGHLARARKPPWAQGVGRSNRPAPTNRIRHICVLQVDHLSKRQVVASDYPHQGLHPVNSLWNSHPQF
jgi:hypothetical protein